VTNGPRQTAPAWTTPVIGFQAARNPGARRPRETSEVASELAPDLPILGFWHIGAVGDWHRIVTEQYAKLRQFGLYDASQTIIVGFIGGRGHELPVPLLGDGKFEVFATDAVEDYEFPTLARAWREARERAGPFLCYYLHTKGASLAGTPRQRGANAWRAYMEYFTLERWQDCAAILRDHDTCGVELQSSDSHYSGNFWWATSDYLRKLPDADRYWDENRGNRIAAEFYLCLARPKAHCFIDFEEDLYEHELPPEAYRR